MNAILDLHEASCDCRHWQCVALTLRRIRKKRWTNIYIFVYDCFLWMKVLPLDVWNGSAPISLESCFGFHFHCVIAGWVDSNPAVWKKIVGDHLIVLFLFSSSKLFCVKNASPSCCTILSLDVILWNQENRKRIRQRMFKILLPV